ATGRAHGSESRRADWIGFVVLTTLMVSLVFALHALPRARAAPLAVVGPFALAAAAFFLLLRVESRAKAPLVDLSFFTRRSFVMGLAIGRCRCSASWPCCSTSTFMRRAAKDWASRRWRPAPRCCR